MDHFVIYARKTGKRGGRGTRKPRAQGLATSGHAALRLDGINVQKVNGRFPRKVTTRKNSTELSAVKQAPVDGLRSFRLAKS